MAQGALTRAIAGLLVLGLGAGAEWAAPASTPAETLADFAVGAGLGCGGAWWLTRAPRPALLALATAVGWFLGTLSGEVGAVWLLAYRGPLLHLALAIPAGRLARAARPLALAGWIGSLLPLGIGGPATAAVAALVALHTLARVRGVASDQRRVLVGTGAGTASLAAAWALAAAGAGDPEVLALVNCAAVAAVGALALSAASGAWTREA
ncbi:MAG TPA: hypothetical protein VI300_31495, partial [Solirubrobacter sp.]